MRSPEQPPRCLSSNLRSIISLLLFMHLFCVFFCIFSVYPPSRFQQRLLSVLTPYAQLTNIDLDNAPYYLTREILLEETFDQFREREYRAEVLPQGNDPSDPSGWIQLGSSWWATGPAYRRLQQLAQLPARTSLEERQSVIAMSLARLGEQETGRLIARLRIRQHVPVPQIYVEEGVPHNPNDEGWFKLAYEALIVGDSVLPIVPNAEAAPLIPDLQSGNVD